MTVTEEDIAVTMMVARKWSRILKCSVDEAFSLCSIGLVLAAKKYDPACGVAREACIYRESECGLLEELRTSRPKGYRSRGKKEPMLLPLEDSIREAPQSEYHSSDAHVLLNRLPKKQKQALWLWAQGCDKHDIARIMNGKPRTAEVNVGLALKRLRGACASS